MENEQDTGYTEFMEAFDDTADYQTDSAEETPEEPAAAEEGGTPESQPTAEEEGQEPEQESSDEGQQEAPEADTTPREESFTLKVNKEEKTYSREEVISLAQKGADYDRVKDQLNQSRQTAADLQTRLDGQQETMEALTEIARDMQMEIPALLDSFRLAAMRKQGLSEDAANERLLRLKAERENARLRAAHSAEKEAAGETSQQRAKREVEEFRAAFPDVELTDALLKELAPGVQGGESLAGAYRKVENARKDAQIAELQRQLAAEKQNKENRISSPGSQKDHGGKHTKSEFDEFMEAFA